MKMFGIDVHNVCDSVKDDGLAGVRLSRLPLEILPEVNEGVQRNTYLTAGCEIRGLLPARGRARIVIQVEDENIIPPLAETYFGCMRGATTLVGMEQTEIVIEEPPNSETMVEIHSSAGFPFSPNLVRVLLPHIHTCRIISIEGDLTFPSDAATPQMTMLSYGSSITNGAHAIRPGGTYTAQTAKHLGVDLINLGFGGSAHMDSAIAEHIASRSDWDFATLEMGINVKTWPLERFHHAVEAFVNTIADANPDKYLFCIDLFTFLGDFTGDETVSIGFRNAVRDIAEKRNSLKVLYVDGREILKDSAGLRTDLVHPNDDGMAEMGQRLADVIRDNIHPSILLNYLQTH